MIHLQPEHSAITTAVHKHLYTQQTDWSLLSIMSAYVGDIRLPWLIITVQYCLLSNFFLAKVAVAAKPKT